MNSFDKIIELIRAIIPTGLIKAQVAENLVRELTVNLKLAEKLQLAESINIYLDLGDNQDDQTATSNENQDQTTLILTTKEKQTQNTIQIQPQNLTIKENSFSIGKHIIIDQVSFWEDNATLTPISVDSLQIFPIILGKEIDIETRQPGRNMMVRFDDLGMDLQLWTDRKIPLVIEKITNPIEKKEGNYSIIVEQHCLDKYLVFNDLPEIIISFDKKVVKTIITMVRKHNKHKNEYFIFLEANSNISNEKGRNYA